LNTNNAALTKRVRLLKAGTIRIRTVIPSFGGFLAISRFGGTAAFSAATSRSSSCLHHFRGEKFIERKEKMTIQTNAGLSRLSNENHEQHETTREEEEHNILMQEEENTTTTNTKEEHWAPLHEDISELRIAEGVALEAKVYGDEDAPVQVVWGHGLGSSMTNEDKESLWNFWDVSERGDASSAGNGTATTTCDEDGSDGSARRRRRR
jgi:hypothetical protein